jgi:hypothetical protein
MPHHDRMTEADAIAHAHRHGLALDPALTVPPPTRGMDPETPEGVLLARIRELAKRWSWEAYHTYDSRKSDIGFPDLVLTDGKDVLMMELKTNTGKATAAQQTWLSLLQHTGKVEAGIWRPHDWPQIFARLTRTTP